MSRIPVIAIFDAGKTNKKLLLFDERYHIVHEESSRLPETTDEDGFACEDVNLLTAWVKDSIEKIMANPAFEIKAVNFSAYGASFVYIDETGQPVLPLYNYLKPYPPSLQKSFYQAYGGESLVAKQTASPVLGNLNSGMQVFRIKKENPAAFSRIKYALHLPQYLSFLLSGKAVTDITSIGCHTNLWHFQTNQYHPWVSAEGITEKFAPIEDGRHVAATINDVAIGVGLHDSSAALIPYLASFADPFILISTGTWCISLNPFNHSMLTDYELHQDCLCYLSYTGKPVKASRLFAGYEHEQQVKRLAAHFSVAEAHYKLVEADPVLLKKLKVDTGSVNRPGDTAMVGESKFGSRDLGKFSNYQQAYHQLIADIISQQLRSTAIVLKGTPVKRIFVDGGFSQNPIYMHLLAGALPGIQVFAASMPQASALGAAMAIHKHWNSRPLPADIISLKKY